jgi:hypothetical protein
MKHVAQIVIGCLALAAVAAASQPSGAPPRTQPRKNLNPRTLAGEKRCSIKTVFVAIRSQKDFRPAYPGRLSCTCVYGPGSAIPT